MAGIWSGDGLSAVLQYLRATAGGEFAILGGDGALYSADDAGGAAGDLRERRTGAGFYVCRECGERESAGGGDLRQTLIAGRVFNIACGERHTLNETYRKLATLLDYPRGPHYGAEREGDVRDSLADISAAREALGYVPTISFDEGLRRTVAWYRGEFQLEEVQ